MICDTSGILSAFAADQPYHVESAEVLRNSTRRLIPPLVLSELDQLIGTTLDRKTSARILEALSGREFRILPYTSATLSKALQVVSANSDVNLGIVDASVVVHAREEHTLDVLTLDQACFRVVRSLEGRPFRLLPFDAV